MVVVDNNNSTKIIIKYEKGRNTLNTKCYKLMYVSTSKPRGLNMNFVGRFKDDWPSYAYNNCSTIHFRMLSKGESIEPICHERYLFICRFCIIKIKRNASHALACRIVSYHKWLNSPNHFQLSQSQLIFYGYQ